VTSKEIGAWSLHKNSDIVPLQSKGQTDEEVIFEEAVVKNPDLLAANLKVVGRQVRTDGGLLDLLGIGEDGKLIVFELKRGAPPREAVTQIIDYASDLSEMSDAELAERIAAESVEHGIDNFEEWYTETWESLEHLRPFRLVIAGVGSDRATERMVNYLAEIGGINISLLTFHAFEQDSDRTLLVRQVEGTEDVSTGRRTRAGVTAEQQIRRLEERIKECCVADLFAEAGNMFDELWQSPSTKDTSHRRSFKLTAKSSSGRNTPRAFACIEPHKGEVHVLFYPDAQKLCPEEFSRIKLESEPGRWRGGVAFRVAGSADWKEKRSQLHELTKAVYEASKARPPSP